MPNPADADCLMEIFGMKRVKENRVYIVIEEAPESLNKLLRMHWARRKRYNEKWLMLIRSKFRYLPNKPPKGKQVVTVSQRRPRLLDEDNLAASCKPIMDALKDLKFIKDDRPEYCSMKFAQAKGKTKTTIINIEPEQMEMENG